jgi:hypothetical protein
MTTTTDRPHHTLFRKPMDELREAFVRARFAETAMFGRPDIEAWLDDPTKDADVVDYQKMPIILTRPTFATTPELMSLLQEHATPAEYGELPRWLEHRIVSAEHHRASFINIIMSLQCGGARVYYPWKNTIDLPPVACIGTDIYCLKAPANALQSLMVIDFAATRHVLEILNAEILGRRPKAESARRFLKELVRETAKDARKKAERDFDEAVAVSADGKRIMKAKWVVVVKLVVGSEWGSRILYPSSAFTGNKCLIDGVATRTHFSDEELTTAKYLDEDDLLMGYSHLKTKLQIWYSNVRPVT